MRKSWRSVLLLTIFTATLMSVLAGCSGAASGFTSMASTYLVLFWIVAVTALMAGCGNGATGNAEVAGPGVTATATVPGPTTTATATVSPVGVASQLAFSVQPGQVERSTEVAPVASSSPGGAFAATTLPPFTVAIEDSKGNIVSTATNPVTIALGNNPNNAQLLGTLTVSAVKGLATFTDVEITNAGVGFTLVASSPGLSGATSNSLTVQPLPPTFGTANSIPAGAGPADLVLADFNGDGHLDIAFNNVEYVAEVTVLLGNGDGTFGAPQNYATPAVGFGIAAADLNGDGHVDLVAGSDSGKSSPTVSVLLGNGDGTFQAAQNLSVATHSFRIAIADLNNDSHLDIVTTNGAATGMVSVLLGNGDGTFQPAVNYGTPGSPLTPVIGDVNGDGKPDLVVTHKYGGVALLLGNGDGTFQAATNILIDPAHTNVGLTLGDFNGDGKLDLATTYYGYALQGGVQVLLGNGDGTFQGPQNYSNIESATIFATDFNLDGKVDLVEAPVVSGNAILLVGNGDGTFQSGVTIGGGGIFIHTGVGIADLNGDLKPDIVSTDIKVSGGGGGVTIIPHQ